MNRFVILLLSMSSTVGFAQAPQIKSGASVYIEPMDGYETYLAAALAKKNVPLIVVTDKGKAEYVIKSSITQRAPSKPAVVVNNTTNVGSGGNDGFGSGFDLAARRAASVGSTSASISVVDVPSSRVVFAYSVGKGRNTNQIQSTAEACAKHLKEFIAKPQK